MELIKTVQHYFETNKCYPGNSDYWKKLFEDAYDADKKSFPLGAEVSDDFGELMKIVNTNIRIVLGDNTPEDIEYIKSKKDLIEEWVETLSEINRWLKSQNSR